MAMPMDACCCDHCNLRNRAASAPLLCTVDVDTFLVRMMNGRAYLMWPMLVAVFCDYRMQQRLPPAAVALAVNNGF